jgi:hypothetical protein
VAYQVLWREIDEVNARNNKKTSVPRLVSERLVKLQLSLVRMWKTTFLDCEYPILHKRSVVFSGVSFDDANQLP